MLDSVRGAPAYSKQLDEDDLAVSEKNKELAAAVAE